MDDPGSGSNDAGGLSRGSINDASTGNGNTTGGAGKTSTPSRSSLNGVSRNIRRRRRQLPAVQIQVPIETTENQSDGEVYYLNSRRFKFIQ